MIKCGLNSQEKDMASPFPGMNPYLEQETVWHDFHERFCPVVAEALTAQVRPHFIVKIDEHVYIHEMPTDTRKLAGRGDVGVASPSPLAGTSSTGTVIAAPMQVDLPAIDMEHLSFVEIRDRANMEVITILELLSPSNKYSGPDREQYLLKRSQFLRSPVHLVELDLLRGGPRLPLIGLPACDYYALVSRVEKRPRADVWPIGVRDALPTVPIPLRAPYEDVHLNLKQVLDRIYDAAGYEDYIYRDQPRLSPEDAAWANQFILGNP
jgi:hypothetical protein